MDGPSIQSIDIGRAFISDETPRPAMKTIIRFSLVLMILLQWVGTDALAAKKPTVLFLIGEKEYNTGETLPAFAERELKPRGVDVLFINAASDDRDSVDCHKFPGLQAALKKADLLFISTRRRFPESADMTAIRKWFADGKPMVGIRTASHPFGEREKGQGYQAPKGHGAWNDFDREILGASYTGHYGSKDHHETLAAILESAKGESILRGVKLPKKALVPSHLYKSEITDKRATALIEATIKSENAREPVAWTVQRGKQRIFYTSLGSKEDMALPWLNRLVVNAVFWALDKKTPAKRADIEGEWKLSITDPEGGTHHPAITLKRDGDGWKAVYRAASDNKEYEATDLTVKDNLLKFTARGDSWTVTYSGKIDGETLLGKVDYDIGGNTGQVGFKGSRNASN